MWADFQFQTRVELFERNIFVIETFALSPLIPELYWFSWESLWVFWIMIHGPSSVFIWRLVDVSRFSSLYKRCVFSRGTFLSLKLSLYLLSFLSCIDSRENAFGVFWIMIQGPSSVFIWRLVEINTLEGPWIIIQNTQRLSHENQYNSGMRGDRAKVSMTKMFLSKSSTLVWNWKSAHIYESSDKYARRTMDHNPKHSKGILTRINTTQEWEEIERKFQWQKCSSRKDASFI